MIVISGTFKHCDLKGLTCLAKHVGPLLSIVVSELLNTSTCTDLSNSSVNAYEYDIKLGGKCYCELGCSNTVYEVVKLLSTRRDVNAPLEVGFVSWPMVRYKREVLFGWVDLLVSFGGIAGLFLGFSLLSGVEIIYYFTIRAFCMVYRDPGELRQLKKDYDNAERPFLDLSLTPGFQRGKIHPMVVRNANNTKIRRSMMNIQYLP
uniref:Uncharacterized protein n=2 Tax=Timema TaxID=61471 RepID=A0A7R9G6Z1_TIMSH|nr:unnamed protein product [Timema shepardi]